MLGKGCSKGQDIKIDLVNSGDKVYFCKATKENFNLLELKLNNWTGYSYFGDMEKTSDFGDGQGDYFVVLENYFLWDSLSSIKKDYREITRKGNDFYLVQETEEPLEDSEAKPKESKKDDKKDTSKKILKKFIKRIKKEQKNKIYSEVTTYNKCADILKDIVLEVGKGNKGKKKGEQ